LLPDALRTAPFAPYLDKIVYSTFKGHKLEKGEDPFHQEGQMRMQMTEILKRNFPDRLALPWVSLPLSTSERNFLTFPLPFSSYKDLNFRP
jgi:hypothetical protein